MGLLRAGWVIAETLDGEKSNGEEPWLAPQFTQEPFPKWRKRERSLEINAVRLHVGWISRTLPVHPYALESPCAPSRLDRLRTHKLASANLKFLCFASLIAESMGKSRKNWIATNYLIKF